MSVHCQVRSTDKRKLGTTTVSSIPQTFLNDTSTRKHPHPTVPMLLHASEAGLVTLLRQCYRSPRCLSARRGERLYTTRILATSSPRRRAGHLHSKRSSSARSLTTTTDHTLEHVAVLGGGITGLSAAVIAAKLNPNAKVTLYESSERVGGYVHSEVVQSSDGPVVFEQGLRSLRPGTTRGHHALAMAQGLRLEEQMVFTSKDSPAGSNRFIYYPDKLVRVPSPNDSRFGMAWTFLTHPLFEGVPAAAWAESSVPKRPDSLVDESIGGFLKRRSGGRGKFVDNVVSAVLHGIYAGDVNQLSVRSLMPRIWEAEEKFGSLTMALQRNNGGEHDPHKKTLSLDESGEELLGQELGRKAREASIYTYKNGMQTLPDALAGVIKEARNADIRMATSVSGISRSVDGKTIQVSIPSPFFNDPSSKLISPFISPSLTLPQPYKLTRPRSKHPTTNPPNPTATSSPPSPPTASATSSTSPPYPSSPTPPSWS